MRKLIGHIFLMLACQLAMGQILSPMGLGLSAAPDHIAKYKDGLIVAYDDRDGNIQLQTWNGHFWNKITTPNLPKTGLKTDGEFKIIDLISLNETIYMAVGYENRETLTDNSRLLMWKNEKWTDISNALINQSLSIKKLFIENQQLKCLGKYIQNNTVNNILKYEDNTWKTEGNAITKKAPTETFESAIYHEQKLYATGNFTSPSSNNISLATWNGTSWEPANYPPFLDKNITLGHFGSEVVVYGKSKFNTSKFKISDGSVWQDISAGLTDIEIIEVRQFAELNNTLFALGQFTNSHSQKEYNLLMYVDDKWQPTSLNLSSIEQIHSWNQSIILSGDFTDNAKLNYIGEVFTDRAQLTARVFEDKNSDWIKDTNEPWLTNYPIRLNDLNTRFQTDNNGVLYLHIDKKTHQLNAEATQYYTPTCPDITINATEYKTYYGSALGVNQSVGISDASIYISDNQGVNAEINTSKTATVQINNKGSQPITNALVAVNMGQSFTLLSSEIPYEELNNGIIKYRIDLSAGDKLNFKISYTVDNLENLEIKATISLAENTTDQNLTDNFSVLSFNEGQTTDNTKYCINEKSLNPNTDQISYKIGIKNTTNSEVVGITLVDELDTTLIISKYGIETVTSHADSKPITTYEYSKNIYGDYTAKLITRWNNISLPPASIDNEGSKAFVDYTLHILPKSLQVGHKICNTALIYFAKAQGRYDEPKMTNTVCSTVGETLSVVNSVFSNNTSQQLTIYPNPASEHIQFTNTNLQDIDIQIINSIGQTLMTFSLHENAQKKMNTDVLPKGIYTVYANGLFSEKIVVQ